MKYVKEKIEARKLYVQEGKSPADISALMNGYPAATTIRNWVNNHKWDEERKSYQQMMYEKLSPNAMEEKIFAKLQQALDEQDVNKSADSLVKVAKTIREVLHPSKNIPMIYQTLTEFVVYLKKYRPELVTPEFLEAFRDFKNYKIGQIQEHP